ncbi:MAG: MYG1 family protein [Verrucomicrobiaceae bacterium]
MIREIVVHPGGAHKDDFLACALLLAKYPVTIYRKDPSEADLADAEVAVVDVGHEWDESKMNFDHHQFPRDSEPLCALSLVLKHFGLYEDAQKFCDWLEVAEWFDTRGPVDTGKWLGVERETLSKLNSPIDITLLRRFAGGTEHAPGEPIWEVMKMVGEDLHHYLTGMKERLAYVAENAEVWEMSFGKKVLFMPRTEPLPDEASAGMGRFVEDSGLADEVVGMVYPDRRGTGYGMSRFNDDKRMEYTRVEAEEDVHFAHAKGFIAKTTATDVVRVRELVEMAWVGE